VNIDETNEHSLTVVLPERGGAWPIQQETTYPSGYTLKDLERLDDHQRKTHVVYFIFCAGFVKIGTSSSLKRRLSNLQIGAPWQTRLVALVTGGPKTEDFLHFVYREHAIGGEWFRLGPDLRQAIIDLTTFTPALKGHLEEEEADYLEWIRHEAERLGVIQGSWNVPGPQEMKDTTNKLSSS
jgi:hypothetical protein